jgi:hypothetical protein
LDPATTTARAPEARHWPIFVFFLFALLPALLSSALTSLLMSYFATFAVTWWLFSGARLDSELAVMLLPFVAMIGLGLIGCSAHGVYEILKDVWYIGNAALVLLVGYVLMLSLRDLRRLFIVFALCGVLASLLHLLPFALNPRLFDLSLEAERKIAPASFLSILAMLLLVASWRERMRLFGRHGWLGPVAFLVCSASVALAASRTMIISLILLLLTLFGWIDFSRASRNVIVAILLALTLLAGWLIPEQTVRSRTPNLFEKLLSSFQETSAQDYTSIADINEKWRGYEAARALLTYERGNALQLLVGQGLGTDVDLGLYMPIGQEKIRYAPILHNGYLYALVKTGAAGLALYVFPLLYFLRYGTRLSGSSVAQIELAGKLIAGLCLVFLFSTSVIAGLLNKLALIPVSLLFGALVAYASRITPGARESVWRF